MRNFKLEDLIEDEIKHEAQKMLAQQQRAKAQEMLAQAKLMCDIADEQIARAKKNCGRTKELEVAAFFTPASAADRFLQRHGQAEKATRK